MRIDVGLFVCLGVNLPLCMRFWTHMFGNGIGALSIHIEDTGDNKLQQIWSLSGEAGNAWYQAEVPVASASPFKVIKYLTSH